MLMDIVDKPTEAAKTHNGSFEQVAESQPDTEKPEDNLALPVGLRNNQISEDDFLAIIKAAEEMLASGQPLSHTPRNIPIVRRPMSPS